MAIKKAIQNANQDEVILVAGKGHEEKQIYKNKILNISDKKIIKKINLKNKIISKKNQNYLQNNLILKKLVNNQNFLNLMDFQLTQEQLKKKIYF